MSGRDIAWGHDQAQGSGRRAEATLVFAVGGGRTVLTGQTVPYPFHITRPFHLDITRPDIATLYLQSASGGLYRGDDLTLAIAARTGAHAHVTTQAATMVHDTGAQPARQRSDLRVEACAFLAYTPDPLVLFSGASLDTGMRILCGSKARAILFDGFTWHDPKGAGRPFGALTQTLEIHDDRGSCLVRERGILHGEDFLSDRSPLGPFRAYGSMVIVAPKEDRPAAAALQSACDDAGCLSGATALPNDAGLMVRCLAPDGRDLRRGLDAAFAVGFAALTGITAAPRRK